MVSETGAEKAHACKTREGNAVQNYITIGDKDALI